MCGGAPVIFHMFRLPAQSFVHTGCCGQGRVKAVSPRTLKEEKEERFAPGKLLPELLPHPSGLRASSVLISSHLCSVCSEWALLPMALLNERLCWREGQQPPDTGLGSVIPDKSKLPAPRTGLPAIPLRTSGGLEQPGSRTHVTKQSHNRPQLHPSLWVEGPWQCSQFLRSWGQSSSPLFSGITEIRTLQPGSAILSLLIS